MLYGLAEIVLESARCNNWETKGTSQPMAISPVKADNAIGVWRFFCIRCGCWRAFGCCYISQKNKLGAIAQVRVKAKRLLRKVIDNSS